MGINDVYPNELIEKAAEGLKKVEAIKQPVWASFAKTGVNKERPPVDKDWWYKRTAAVLRTVQILGPIGVNKLRAKYGGKQRRGHQPAIFKKGSGSVIRKVLQQLDKAGFTKSVEKGVHKGRIITKEGKLFLNKIAEEIMKSKGIEVKKEPKPVEKKEEVKEEKPETKKEEKKEASPAASKEEAEVAGKKETPKEETKTEKPKEIPKKEEK
jgi:small subunit ribosomal protein S19e